MSGNMERRPKENIVTVEIHMNKILRWIPYFMVQKQKY